jgi:cyclophilin family peptidyl-prolyl cis-trans isomerase/HEAT repeat protein
LKKITDIFTEMTNLIYTSFEKEYKKMLRNSMKAIFFALLAITLVTSCDSSNSAEELPSTLDFDINNLVVQEVFELQDKRATKELLDFLKQEDASYRYLAAMGLASVQDTSDAAINALGKIADTDDDEMVRFAAIYALGQTYHSKATQHILKAFRNDDATGDNRLNSAVLEAIGKCGDASFLDLIVKPTKYANNDTLLLEGQSWGVYRFALRDIANEAGTKKMVDYVNERKTPLSVRRIAANYLGRAKIDLDLHKEELLQTIRDEKDVIVKMSLVKSMAKVTDEDFAVMAALKLQYSQASDYRVKVNIMRILAKYDYEQVSDIFFSALKDKNNQTKLHAAAFFRTSGKRIDVDKYYAIGTDSTLTNWRLQINMLGAALANVSYTRGALRKEMNERLISIYNTSKNPYEKGLALEALAGFAVNYRMFIQELQKADNHPFVKNKALESLATIRKNPKLQAIFGEYYSGVAATIRNGFKSAISSGDVGLAAAAAAIIRTPKFKYNNVMRYDYDFLKEAQSAFKNPKGMEAYYEIQRTIDYIEGNPTAEFEKPEFNHPINWGTIKKLTSTSKATISTDKGNIVVQLFYKDAPGSVGNFLKLANDGFYDGKSFHRIVPNFVAQGGCPRGDGYGGLDYSIRSELAALKYDEEGYLGMASAGKDTEGVQFFITHSPTPHLDGKYTIFAKVVEGMDVVHELLVGDKITTITAGEIKPEAAN